MSLKAPKNFRPEPFAYHTEVEMKVENLTNNGQGVGRIHNWVILVPYALPGEKIRARIYKNHKNYSEGDLIEVLDSSPHRIEPPCSLFGVCGGCHYQHLEYQEQLAWKKRQVQELLKHTVNIESTVHAVIPSPKQYHYRSKITPHFQKPKNKKISAIGFLKTGRRQEIVDVAHCLLASEAINRALPQIRTTTFEKAADYRRGATLLLRDSQGKVVTDSQSTVHYQVGSLQFSTQAGDFFQNNPSILEAFTQYVRNQAAQETSSYLIDAYCGSGLFCLTAASAFKEVLGIEISENSLHWAQKNAQNNHIDNCTFLCGKAESLFANVSFPSPETSLIIDPPRKGCSKDFIEQLLTYRPQIVVYISCNPATQMRDLPFFLEAGYVLQAIQPFDLFPQTKHLECIITLRNSS